MLHEFLMFSKDKPVLAVVLLAIVAIAVGAFRPIHITINKKA